MVTKYAASQYINFQFPVPHLSIPVISFMGFRYCNERRRGLMRAAAYSGTFLRENSFSLGLVEVRRRTSDSRCKGRRENNGEAELEAEILEFMNKSERPDKFPTKKELLNGGRMDLVDAILKNGGWLTLGWDSDDDESDQQEICTGGYAEKVDFDIVDFQERVESLQERISFQEADFESTDSSQSASSSGRSLDMPAENNSGILGILNRLEKERNLSLGTDLRSNGHQTIGSGEYNGDHSVHSRDIDMAGPGENIKVETGSPTKRMLSDSVSVLSNNGSVSGIDDSRYSVNPNTWRAWSRERAGLRDIEFEAAEICFYEDKVEGDNGQSHSKISVSEGTTEGLNVKSKLNHRQIQTRLQQMGHELESTLHLLRSQRKDLIQKGHKSSPEYLQKLSDTWEFHETDVMNAQAKLRSIHAKLAILEGKIALSIIESQKIVEEKQRRIDCARRALQLLRTTTIIWPNSASEVLLAGSFDGWITQRTMEKSRTGIFSVTLQLYPGRYEIKFIVDGVWRCDPLRPTVHSDGYENNILIIT